MKKIAYLENHDILEPDDLVRSIFPYSYYGPSDDEGGSTFYWKLVKFEMPVWVGKKVGEYRSGSDDTSQAVRQMFENRAFIRSDLALEELGKLGIPVCLPKLSTRKMWQETYGTLGRQQDYGKDLVLKFGKHRGEKVSDLVQTNIEYLEWLVREATNLSNEDRRLIRAWIEDEQQSEERY